MRHAAARLTPSSTTCLAHAECHPVGTHCYCPPLASCACSGGKFLFCEPEDGVRHCVSDDDCTFALSSGRERRRDIVR